MVTDLSNIEKTFIKDEVQKAIDEEDDMFQKVLDIQQQMQEKYYPNVEAMDMPTKMLISSRAITHEVLEVENELNWKHWKIPILIDNTKVKDELVDVFIFFMNLVNAADMSSNELYDRTLAKIDVNIERQKSGY